MMPFQYDYEGWYWFVCCDVLAKGSNNPENVCWSCGELTTRIALYKHQGYSPEVGLVLRAASASAGVRMRFSHEPEEYYI